MTECQILHEIGGKAHIDKAGDYDAVIGYRWTYCQKMFHFLHTTILTMCTAEKVNLNLEAKAPLRCRLS
jgi:hypothetical protein